MFPIGNKTHLSLVPSSRTVLGSVLVFAFDNLTLKTTANGWMVVLWSHTVFMLKGKSPVSRLHIPQAQILSKRERKGGEACNGEGGFERALLLTMLCWLCGQRFAQDRSPVASGKLGSAL